MEPLVSAAEEVLAAAPGELQTVPPAPSAALAGLADIQSVSASLKDEVRAMSEALHQYRLYHLSSTESIALIDNTTLASAGTLLMGENAPTPHVLLDLATFVNEYVLSDRLVFLPAGPSLKRTHEGMEYLTNRFPALRPLNVSPALEECLVRVWVDSREWIESLRASAFSTVSQSFADELARGWRSLLPPHAEEAFAPESVLPNPLEASIEFGTAGVSGFFDHLWGITHIPVDLGQQMRPIDLQTIRLSNYRAIYNVCVGLVLRIPYRGSVTRLPARRALWELGRSLDAVLEARERMGLSHELDAQYRQAVERLRGRRQVGVQLPVMLTYLLRKIGRLEDFPAALLELRERMAGLRSRRKEIEAVINGTADSAGADAQLDQLLAAFSDDVSAASIALGAGVPVTAATAGAVVAASSGPPGWLIGGLAAAAAAGGYARPLSSLWRRIRHRDLEIVRDIGQTTRTFLDARGRIESLWSFDTSRYDYEERFDRMAALQVL